MEAETTEDEEAELLIADEPAGWFHGKEQHNAHRILLRWTEQSTKQDDMAFCGNIYSQYFHYKVAKVCHVKKKMIHWTFLVHITEKGTMC